MIIEDKDIDKLLENFQIEEIITPKKLDEKLNNKLKSLKLKRHKKILLSTVVLVLVFILSYINIPNLKSFADDIFKYIFGDIGIENAVNNGYDNISNTSVNIAGYNIDITNIYMDNFRISFDATMKDTKGINESSGYSIFVKNEELGSISVENGFFLQDGKITTASILIMGDGVSKLFENKKEKVELVLELSKEDLESDDSGFKRKILGSNKITIDIPKEVYDNKVITINQNINDNNLDLKIDKLEVSPTMMYLDTKGTFKDNLDYNGLYNFRIISDSGNTYKDSLTLSATGNLDNYRQTIVPSIYYDKSKSFRLKADGVWIKVNKEVKLNLYDKYPKNINLYGEETVIKDVSYKDNKLVIKIIGNNKMENWGIEGYIDDKSTTGSGSTESEENKKEFFVEFEIEKRDSYDVDLGVMMKYEIPIDIKVNK